MPALQDATTLHRSVIHGNAGLALCLCVDAVLHCSWMLSAQQQLYAAVRVLRQSLQQHRLQACKPAGAGPLAPRLRAKKLRVAHVVCAPCPLVAQRVHKHTSTTGADR